MHDSDDISALYAAQACDLCFAHCVQCCFTGPSFWMPCTSPTHHHSITLIHIVSPTIETLIAANTLHRDLAHVTLQLILLPLAHNSTCDSSLTPTVPAFREVQCAILNPTRLAA